MSFDITSVETLDVKDKLVLVRVKNVKQFVGSTHETLKKLQEVLHNNGANSVIVFPEDINIETLSDSDLTRMGLARIVSDFYKELQDIK